MTSTLITLLIIALSGNSTANTDQTICFSKSEMRLIQLINAARVKKGLKKVSPSAGLTKVAMLHAKDLQENEPFDEKCNPHSWSNQGIWKSCCYTQDHSNADCMWKKPAELTDYQGDGYEIVAFWQSGDNPSEEISAETALRLWLDSPGHSNVILNNGTFQNVEWNAVGVGIFENYASVWFGMEKDNHPPPSTCPD